MGERELLEKAATPFLLDLYHLERIGAILDVPAAYGLRLEFLGIEMTKEERISAFQGWADTVAGLQQAIAALTQKKDVSGGMKKVTARQVGGLSTSVYSHIFPPKIKTCTCGEVFEATSPALTSASFVFGATTEVVTCPNCGRTFAF